MNRQDILTQLIQYHTVINYFDYNHAIEWAMFLLKQDNTDEDILMLASFSEPINKFEIKPYVSRAIKAVGLEEKTNVSEAENIFALLYVNEIIENRDIRKNLLKIEKLYFNTESNYRLTPLYLLSCAWDELDYNTFSYYYLEATIDNIESISKEQAKLFIDNFNIADADLHIYTPAKKQKIPFFKRILNYLNIE